jgi:tRNA threonylcarbamoyladenosine biosynthesis protein TsaB
MALKMLTLAVDTGTQAGSLAVLRDTRVLGVVSTWTDETYSSRMFRHLEFLLSELKLGLKQFDLFAVGAGPGSFTGLRVGLTAVKGWAEVYQKPIAAVSALEAVAAQARAGEGLLAPVMDARHGQIYAGVYRRSSEGLARVGDERVMTADEFLGSLRREAGHEKLVFVTPTPEVLAEALARSDCAGSAVEEVSTVLAPVIGQLGVARARRGEVVDALHLDANYIRRSDAELLWKGP